MRKCPRLFQSSGSAQGPARPTGGFLCFLIVALLAPASLPAHGAGDEELLEHFGEHLDDFEAEIEHLVAHVDEIVTAYGEGRAVASSIDELIGDWEQVVVHEVIETKAVHLYPPIWQGIYAMIQAAESGGQETAMARGGERTKSALWQGLGGLRVLAAMPGAGLSYGPAGGDMGGAAAGLGTADNHIELTGDDNMRFDRTAFVVHAGEPVTLVFRNIGELPKEVMGHNVVVLDAGTAIDPFGMAAAEVPENDFIPLEASHQESILAHTELLGPGESDEISFMIEEPGSYPFICSFTAHFRIMQGIIRAVPNPVDAPVEAILEWLKEAASVYEQGNAKEAEAIVHETYMGIFEGLEGDLIERNPELVTALELDFNARLPGLFQQEASMDAVYAQLETMRTRLELAKELLAEAEAARPSVF